MRVHQIADRSRCENRVGCTVTYSVMDLRGHIEDGGGRTATGDRSDTITLRSLCLNSRAASKQ